jgi:hypothetical protein
VGQDFHIRDLLCDQLLYRCGCHPPLERCPLPTLSSYEHSVYGRLEESICEYMDDEMIDKLVPHLKKTLCAELAQRRKAAAQVESVMHTLFPGEGYEAAD